MYFSVVVCVDGLGDFFFFFFQAEDGIRDLVRSRGLGDVYKRQYNDCYDKVYEYRTTQRNFILSDSVDGIGTDSITTVSYTHLTLPTSDLV